MKPTGRKILTFILALVMTASVFSAATHADPPDVGGDGHIHRWTVAERAEATCTQEGYILYKCGDPSCEESPYKEITSPALGHAWNGGEITRQPSCTEEGVRTYTCTRCGATTTESIPRTGHTPETIPGKGATCEEPGLTDGQKCAVCGQILVQQEEMEPIGHRWDAGKTVKEASNLGEDTEILYTCLNDPSHTKTETVSAASAMFSRLRLTPKKPPKGQESTLEIVTQPVGGHIVRFGPGTGQHTFTVEVTGGTPDYTYEWHCVDEEKASVVTSHEVTGNATAAGLIEAIIAGSAQDKQDSHMGKITGWKDIFPAIENVDFPEIQEAEPVQAAVYKPGDTIVGHGQTHTTTGGGKTYYCIIYDSAGDHVETDHVALKFDLSIAKQPLNCNIRIKEDAPKVEPIDGTPPYSYDWYYIQDGQPVPTDDHDSKLNAMQNGDYYCIVKDDADGEVQSDTVSVYSAPALEISATAQSKNDILDGEETVELDVYVIGGVPPYSAKYYGWAGSYDTEPEMKPGEGDDDTIYLFPVKVDRSGDYIFEVEDSKGKTASTTLELPYRQLKIARQLWYHVIEGSENRMLDMELSEGEFPITYDLYRIEPGWDEDGFTDGLLTDSWTDDSLTVQHEVEDSGLYYIIATDSSGRWARSETISVEVAYLRMYACTSYVQVEDDSRAAVLQAKVTGKSVTGVDAVTFDWYRLNEKEGMQPLDQTDPYVAVVHNVNYFTDGNVNGLENRIEVTMPGYYTCIARDSDGNMAASGNMRVNYVDSKPYFVIQPESVKIPGSSTSQPRATLTCEAVSGDENRRGDEYKDEIVYDWGRYDKDSGYWKPIPVDSAFTNTLELIQEYDFAVDEEETIPLISGRYRCEAFDLSTAKHSYSNTALVEHTLEFGYYSAKINRDGTANINWGFYGGCTPYTVSVSVSKWHCMNKEYDYWVKWPEVYPIKRGCFRLEEKEGSFNFTIFNVPTLDWYGGKDNPHYDGVEVTIRLESASGEVKSHQVHFTPEGRTEGKEL